MIPTIKNPQQFTSGVQQLTKEKLENELKVILSKIDENITGFDGKFPSAASINQKYKRIDNTDWTTSFWTGMIWLAYEMTDEKRYLDEAMRQVEDFKNRYEKQINFDHHDLGFLYTLSCVSAYKLTKNEMAKQTAINAADCLLKRFKEKGQFLQAWGRLDDPKAYRLIIDCMMNLPLLYWASEATGDNKYYDIAYTHAKTCMDVIIRPDASTYHTFYFDPETGERVKGVTAQGYADDSCWARGQAWGVYGSALSYMYTKDPMFIGRYKAFTNYFLNFAPEDLVAYWDLIFTEGDEERDSSASAIAVCGMLEMVKHLPDSEIDKKVYYNAARSILNSLIDNYSSRNTKEAEGLILHSVYSKPGNAGVDECSSWGDYYYMEAIVRLLKDWELYW